MPVHRTQNRCMPQCLLLCLTICSLVCTLGYRLPGVGPCMTPWERRSWMN